MPMIASLRKKTRRNEPTEVPASMSPMIDVVFQLLIFFALIAWIQPAPFLSLEARDGHEGEAPLDDFVDRTVDFFLDWEGTTEDGLCRAWTFQYRSPDGTLEDHHPFGLITPGEGEPWRPNRRLGYPYPDFHEIRAYLQRRQASLARFDLEVRVVLRFADTVPVQMVVNVVDLCTELKISDVQVGAGEVE